MKHMKRSMFITTLIMTVVLVVALSTATFAWYTANSSVTATRTSVTSASSGSASLVIDNQRINNPNATTSSVDLTLAGENHPMVYTSDSAVVVNTTTYADFVAAFKTFTRNGSDKFASVPTSVAPGTLSAVSGTGSSNDIYLSNVGGVAMSSVSTTVTIEPFYEVVTGLTVGTSSVTNYYTESAGVYTKITSESAKAEQDVTYYQAGHDYLRVAVFAGNYEDDDDELVLKGIYGAGTAQRANATALAAAVVGGDIGTAVGNATLNADLTTASAFKASGTSLAISGSVAQYGAVKVKVVVWFEGVSMLNADASKAAAFTMTFAAA